MDEKQKKRRLLLKAAGLGVIGASVGGSLNSLDAFSSETKVQTTPEKKISVRENPRNGDKLPTLGFGCMRLPMLQEATHPGGAEVDEEAFFEMVDLCLAHGLNYFDTAYGYHSRASQVLVGKALKRHPREAFFLATKMPGYLKPSLTEAQDIFFEQLRDCQVEYFDYYLLHNMSQVKGYQDTYEKEGVLAFLQEQKAAGRIRNLGWSFHGDKAMLEYLLSCGVDWDFALVQLNYHDLLYENRKPRWLGNEPAPAGWMYERLLEANLPLMVMEPLLGGRLARLNKKTLAVLQAERPDMSGASWAFRYAANLPNVLTVLSGMTYMEHLEDNIRTFTPLEPLSSKEMEALQKALPFLLSAENIPCTTCGYCVPCPYGVDIPAVFLHHNNAIDDGNIPDSEKSTEYTAARRAYLITQARQLKEFQGPSHCTGCGKCLTKCPQFIDIATEMARISEFNEELIRKG